MAYRYGATLGPHGRHPRDPAVAHAIPGAGNSSAAGQTGGARTHGAPTRPADELTGAARIRNAAVELFGEHGFQGVTLKEIAERAGVSAPLVIHHFGSKAGLRKACDRYAAEVVHQVKTESVEQERNLSPQYVLAASRETKPVLCYLFQAFAAGGEEADALLDQMIEDALEYTEEAEQRGLVRPSRNPRHRTALLLLQSFGAMMLHRQLKRLLGTSPVEDPPEQWGPYFDAVLEIHHGVFEPGTYENLGDALAHHPSSSSPGRAGSERPERSGADTDVAPSTT